MATTPSRWALEPVPYATPVPAPTVVSAAQADAEHAETTAHSTAKRNAFLDFITRLLSIIKFILYLLHIHYTIILLCVKMIISFILH